MNNKKDIKKRLKALNNDFVTLHHELHERYIQLENELDKDIDFKTHNLGINAKYGIVNLSKINEESIFDAIRHFDKKCPYCQSDRISAYLPLKI